MNEQQYLKLLDFCGWYQRPDQDNWWANDRPDLVGVFYESPPNKNDLNFLLVATTKFCENYKCYYNVSFIEKNKWSVGYYLGGKEIIHTYAETIQQALSESLVKFATNYSLQQFHKHDHL